MIENWRVKNEANFKKAAQKRREHLGRKEVEEGREIPTYQRCNF